MSKRFTETTKWNDPWFSELTAEQKILWIYLCDNCDNSGVIDFSERLAIFSINGKDSMDLKCFGNKIETLKNGKIFIPSFVNFQFGQLKPESNLHKNVIQCIKKNGLEDRFFKGSSTLNEGLIKGQGIVKVKVEVKEYTNVFEGFWELTNRKGSKKEAFNRFEDRLKIHTLEDIQKAYSQMSTEKKDSEIQFWPDISGFLNSYFDGYFERSKFQKPKQSYQPSPDKAYF